MPRRGPSRGGHATQQVDDQLPKKLVGDRQVGKDKAAAEELVMATDIDWTLVYPPSLTDGTRTDTYRSGETLELKGLPKISRGDVAEFMLSQLEQATYSRKIAIVGP
jgi:putative NADH-flavin reductase